MKQQGGDITDQVIETDILDLQGLLASRPDLHISKALAIEDCIRFVAPLQAPIIADAR